VLLLVIFSCKKEKNHVVNNSISLKNDYNCCDSIIIFGNNVDSTTKKEICIFYRKGGDQLQDIMMDITYLIQEKTDVILITYWMYIDSFVNYKQIYWKEEDTIRSNSKIKKFYNNLYGQDLLKLPCGINYYYNLESCFSNIVVYIRTKEKAECYRCCEKEVKNHPEFQYFLDIFDDTTYFKIKLSDIKKRKKAIVDSLAREENKSMRKKL